MKQLAIITGDGIGPEIIQQASRALEILIAHGKLEVNIENVQAGAAAYCAVGHPYPKETAQVLAKADAILFGPVGDSRYDHIPNMRPDSAIGAIRQQLKLNASLRQITIQGEAASLSPMRSNRVNGVDIAIVREMGGDVYFGQPKGQRTAVDGPCVGDPEGYDTMRYARGEVVGIARRAFEVARKRRGYVVSADKANVLETSRLWRKTVDEVAQEYPDITLEHLYADNVAMQLVSAPSEFDVILTANMFGDILSDIASVLTGSVGLPASVLFNDQGQTLYEPGHGSAWDIAGQDRANPISAMRCVGLMMVHTFQRPDLSSALEDCITAALNSGCRTAELYQGEGRLVSCQAMADAILANLTERLA